MICKKCGGPTAENWQFCHNCGERLQQVVSPANVNQPTIIDSKNSAGGPVNPPKKSCFGRLIVFIAVAWLIYSIFDYFF